MFFKNYALQICDIGVDLQILLGLAWAWEEFVNLHRAIYLILFNAVTFCRPPMASKTS